MDKADIAQMVEWFAAAASPRAASWFRRRRAARGNTPIMRRLCRPTTTSATTSTAGRSRTSAAAGETLQAVKAPRRRRLPVWVRLDGEELRTGAASPWATRSRQRGFSVQAGADAVSMSAYATITTGVVLHRGTAGAPARGLVGYAAAVKKEVPVPVIAAGRISPGWRTKASAKSVRLRRDGSQAARRPRARTSFAAGKAAQVRPCVYCYVCVSQIFINQRVKVRRQPAGWSRVRMADDAGDAADPCAGGRRRYPRDSRRREWPRCAATA